MRFFFEKKVYLSLKIMMFSFGGLFLILMMILGLEG